VRVDPRGSGSSEGILRARDCAGEIREGRRVSRDVAAGRSELRLYQDSPSVRIIETGTELGWQNEDTSSIVDGDPLSAAITCRST
jgi:hypothetical protein